ncbi:major capsid protein [Vibrio phage 1.111.B._10N.286.45.E6]|nr:major capsid protein [Vibrio phage 1.111.A._10N.286.45.E6]AUR88272.1 major capsid protein [Vibrio phage 1.111.B._10N.286.45.E6]
MKLTNFKKKEVVIALSNVASRVDSRTPLLKTLFKTKPGIKGTSVTLTKDSRTGKLLAIGDRANSNNKNAGNTMSGRDRTGYPVNAVHVTAFHTIYAEDIQDVPELENNDALEEFNSYMAEETADMSEVLDSTLEYHCFGALVGAVMDANGTDEVYNLHTIMKTTKVEISPTDAELETEDRMNDLLEAAKSNAKKKLRGSIIKGYAMFCGPKAYAKYRKNIDVKSGLKNNQVKYVVDGFTDGFNYSSIDFIQYDGGIGEVEFIGDYESILVPIVDGLFVVQPTSGVGTDMVNKKGMKTYITTKELDHGIGVELKGQKNYVVYCEKPDSVTHINFEQPA